MSNSVRDTFPFKCPRLPEGRDAILQVTDGNDGMCNKVLCVYLGELIREGGESARKCLRYEDATAENGEQGICSYNGVKGWNER
ncbi:MAG: hypothetical protein US89_C0015G0037 [Candidatus Peregrinibacteria bacterium GW2011_GWF2_38_29]|nr:MAG: hypothetical protein US89_C0015G0037 [Candidatus Peregrinibacteria bacterium GW2011_GWF2_38_29]HBB02303.1 hypothetical protein [Candidatus Peregrinibacteria bacterium]